jgi:hypothetical protein
VSVGCSSSNDMQKIDSKARNEQRFRLKLEHGLEFTDEFDFPYINLALTLSRKN